MTPPSTIREYSAAAIVTVFGTVLAAISATYPLGNMLHPGPGFVPLAVGVLIAALGLVIALESWQAARSERAGGSDRVVFAGHWFKIRPVLAVTLGMVAFALIVDRFGYVAATVVLVFVSAFGERRRNWLPVLGIAVFMSVFGSLLFIWGLGLPVNIFGSK